MARFPQRYLIVASVLMAAFAQAGVGENRVKCGAPAAAGVVRIQIDSSDPQSTINVPIPAAAVGSAVLKARAIADAINGTSGFTAERSGSTVKVIGVVGNSTTIILKDTTGEFTAGQRFASLEIPVESGWFALPTTAVASGITGLGEPSEIQFGFGTLEDEEALDFGQRFTLSENTTSLQILGQLDSYFTGAGLATGFSTYDVEGEEFTRLDVNLGANDAYTWALWGSTDTGLPWGGGFSTVPEPASLALLIGGILVYGRRR